MITETQTLERVAAVLDTCRNALNCPLGPEARARIFAAVDDCTEENWRQVRTVILTPYFHSVWQAVKQHTGSEEKPDDGQVILTAVETLLRNWIARELQS